MTEIDQDAEAASAELPKLTEADQRDLAAMINNAKAQYHSYGVVTLQAKKRQAELEAVIGKIDEEFTARIKTIAKSHGVELGKPNNGKVVLFDQDALVFISRDV
jgi:hypothetical protein